MKDLLAGLVAFLMAIKEALGGFLLGISLEQARDAERELKRMEKSAEAVDDVRKLPRAERLRLAKQRGLYRVPDTPPADE